MSEPTPQEWEILSRKVFPKKDIHASPFLWTRILAAIETEEARRQTQWWREWGIMWRFVTATSALVVTFLYWSSRPTSATLEVALQGGRNSDTVVQVAMRDTRQQGQWSYIILGGQSWPQK